MIKFSCKCGKEIKVADEHAGKNGKCPHCGKLVKIPESEKANATPMKSVVCGKCKHEQDVPAELTNKIFMCEKCGSSTLPTSKEQTIPRIGIEDAKNYSTENYQEDFSGTSYNSKHHSSSPPRRLSNINRAFVPERFSQYLSHSESIRFASNPSLASLVLRLITPVLGLIIFFISISFIPTQERFDGYNAMVTGVIAVSLITIAALIFSWKFTYYIVTDRKVFSSSGVFNRRITIIPLTNVHTISINTGIIDSLLKLNSIVFSSAGNGGGGFIFRWFPFMTQGTLVFKYVDSAPEICRFISE